jgi:hypothetical protein
MSNISVLQPEHITRDLYNFYLNDDFYKYEELEFHMSNDSVIRGVLRSICEQYAHIYEEKELFDGMGKQRRVIRYPLRDIKNIQTIPRLSKDDTEHIRSLLSLASQYKQKYANVTLTNNTNLTGYLSYHDNLSIQVTKIFSNYSASTQSIDINNIVKIEPSSEMPPERPKKQKFVNYRTDIGKEIHGTIDLDTNEITYDK